VDYRGQQPACPPPSQPATLPSKKNSASILSSLQQLWRECAHSFAQQRLADRAQALSLSSLLCFGRHTVTGLLTTSGCEFQDWTATYRLFSQGRLPVDDIFAVVRRAILAELPPSAPFSIAVDDSLLRKSGIRIPGVAWRRDPLGPPFQCNFVRAQRFLQLSAAIPLADGAYRMIPVAFRHAPPPPRPAPNASTDAFKDYRRAARLARLPLLAAEQIAALRQALDAEPSGAQRPLHVSVDGGYTNETVLKNLPARTILIGRIRKDAKLYFLPQAAPAPQRGRPRRYGAPAPTPEQIRTDESTPWKTIDVCISGAPHQMRVKRLGPVLWRTAGLAQLLQAIVIAPLSYRLRKNSKLLYRRPAFLICTDAEMDLRSVVQRYVQRWDIEVNFREEKTLLGVGQAQVRNAQSVQAVPALQVASYSLLLLATLRALKTATDSDLLPAPKWNPSPPQHRVSTPRAINQLRAELWGRALGLTNFSGFVAQRTPATKSDKFLPDLPSAVLYAVN